MTGCRSIPPHALRRCRPPWRRRPLLTVSGDDRPGVTARLFAALADTAGGGPSVEVLDVEQVVVQGHLVLGVVVAAQPADGSPAADPGDAAGAPGHGSPRRSPPARGWR